MICNISPVKWGHVTQINIEEFKSAYLLLENAQKMLGEILNMKFVI